VSTFKEGDRVRNLRVEMGTGTITRHGFGPRSVRWTRGGEACWWVTWPDYRDPKWVPGLRGTTGWYYESALEPDRDGWLTEMLRADYERRAGEANNGN